MKIRRALISVSDKEGIEDLARSLSQRGVEIVATGNTGARIKKIGVPVREVESLSRAPEAFQGRMKTLAFPILSAILFRRGDESDERDAKALAIEPIDLVVVNFYPFERAVQEKKSGQALIEEVDIGGPTLVRAAAKNAPDVVVLTSPDQYAEFLREFESGEVSDAFAQTCAQAAWERVLSYDSAIARELGGRGRVALRYGENPHQEAFLEFDPQGPIAWGEKLTDADLSYNNIQDVSAAYAVLAALVEFAPTSQHAVIVKHGNPCGVASLPETHSHAQRLAITRAWEGDPVSAFGGVILLSRPLEEETVSFLDGKFIECLAAPGLGSAEGKPIFSALRAKRKNLKAVRLDRLREIPGEMMSVVPGGRLFQSTDRGADPEFKSVSRKKFPSEKMGLVRFGVGVCRELKSNAIAVVREIPEIEGGFELLGAGQGQPNRVDALGLLAIPRAQATLSRLGGRLSDCLLVSDAFFPFRDSVDAAHRAGVGWIVQPGGSVKDAESIAACDEHGIAMAFTGRRHFKH